MDLFLKKKSSQKFAMQHMIMDTKNLVYQAKLKRDKMLNDV